MTGSKKGKVNSYYPAVSFPYCL